MSRITPALCLEAGDRQQMEKWLAAQGTPPPVALRSRMVLAAGEGQSDSAIAKQLQINRKTVILWRHRFAQQGPGSRWEVAPGRGRKPRYGADQIQALVDATWQTKPKGMTPWSCRLMAQSQRVSKSTLSNIGRSHNLKPQRVKTFKLSRDPKFLEKLTDGVGLYRNPPQQAIVRCLDEKNQIQARDRPPPGLPFKKGRCGTMRHDDKRKGTTRLFAALELLQGRVIGPCYARHRHPEWLKFLRRLDEEFPGEVPLHLVRDNYGTPKTPPVQAGLKRHPRFILHFVPTRSSWLNLVERWLGELTSKRVRRGWFFSVEDLPKALQEFLEAWNDDPKPFVWTATVDSIEEKLSRCRQTLEQIRPGCTQPRTRKKRNQLSS